jgi:hypothetical protein
MNIKYYMKTGITETGITGVGIRDAGTLETGITGGFPKIRATQKIGLKNRHFD